MNTKTEAVPSAKARKPWLSLFFATAGGAGYLPAVPGTWGSIVGVVFFWVTVRLWVGPAQVFVVRNYRTVIARSGPSTFYESAFVFLYPVAICILIALVGVLASARVALYAQKKDPQIVVIDEVSGIIITLLLGLGVMMRPPGTDFVGSGIAFYYRLLNWKYLLLGFILFRGFDVWKPFPARQAEALPGGWGIMADDWVAGIYAAIGLWIARGLGL